MEKIGNIAAPVSAENDSFDAWYKTVQEFRKQQSASKQELSQPVAQQKLVSPVLNDLAAPAPEPIPAPSPENTIFLTNEQAAALIEERNRLIAEQNSSQVVDIPQTAPQTRAEERDTQTDEDLARSREIDIQRARDIAKQEQIDIAATQSQTEQEENQATESIDHGSRTDTFAEIDRLIANSKNGKIDEKTAAKLLEARNSLIQENTKQEQSHPEIFQNNRPLAVINADMTHDAKEIAHDLAERALNTETANGNFITRIWKGNLFKKFYEQKYTREYLEGKRTDENGKTLNDLIREQKPAVIERFVLGAVEDERFIHGKIGKKDADGNYQDGEKLIPADEKTNQAVKEAIEKYAKGRVVRGENLSNLTREFKNDISRIMQEAADNGDSSKIGFNNLLDVAKEAANRYQEIAISARNKAEHDAAMAQVMAGFQVYNADVRNNVRTESHRDNIDKIVNKIESHKIGRFVQPEIIAGVAGAAAGLAQIGAKAALSLGFAGAGVIVSSAVAGLKERNRYTEDRARMLRDIASGRDYGYSHKHSINNHEKHIAGTLYDMEKATDLTTRIKDAIERGSRGEKGFGISLMQAIAEARVRIDFSDSEQKDLISYSSDKNRGTERLELDKMLIQAEKMLSSKGKKDYEYMQSIIRGRIIEGYKDESGHRHYGVAEQDKKFKNARALAALAKSGKTFAFGLATFFASQEVTALFDTNKIGIFEKIAGTAETKNAVDAKETLLASGFGIKRGSYEIPGEPNRSLLKSSDPNEISRLESMGYRKQLIRKAWTESRTRLEDVDPSASTARVDVKYDGWASGGTKAGSASIIDGKFVANLSGSASVNGQSLNYDPTSVKAFITVGDSKFEIAGKLNEAGQMTWGDNGVFTTTTGETIKAIGDNGEKLYRYFEVAVENNVDASEGVRHIIPLATDVGSDSFSDKITQLVEGSIEHPAMYELTKEIPQSTSVIRDYSTAGFAFSSSLSRAGLGEARNTAETAVESPEATPASAEPELTANANNAPESAPEGPEGESAIAPYITQYEQAIRENTQLLGEDIAYALLSNDSNPFNRDNWNTAVENLSPEGIRALQSIDSIYRSMPNTTDNQIRNSMQYGNSFRTFLAANYPNLLQAA